MSEKRVKPYTKFLADQNVSDRVIQRQWMQGIGPRKTYIGARIFIADEDEREWVERMRNPTGKTLKIAKANAAMLRKRSMRAVQARRERRQA